MYLCHGMKAVRYSPLRGGDFRTIHAASQKHVEHQIKLPNRNKHQSQSWAGPQVNSYVGAVKAWLCWTTKEDEHRLWNPPEECLQAGASLVNRKQKWLDGRKVLKTYKWLPLCVMSGDNTVLPLSLLYPNNSEVASYLPDWKVDDGTVSVLTVFLSCPYLKHYNQIRQGYQALVRIRFSCLAQI